MKKANKPFVGLLPLYLKMYDERMSELRPMMQAFADETAKKLESAGLKVFTAPICRIESEFRAAVRSIEESGAEMIVTLHLAYSPSLESLDALLSTKLPLIVLDTTQTYDFAEKRDNAEIMANHGIHGVQDMCSMLRRYGKTYWIEAGHMEHSDVLERVFKRARAVSAAAAFCRAKIGIIGRPFKGMGDFQVPFEKLKSTLGIEVEEFTAHTAKDIADTITDDEIEEETKLYKKSFNIDGSVNPEDFETTVRSCLTVRRWIEKESLTGFSFCFLDINDQCGVPTVPFIEACLAMSRGLGYAGEGDVLTAAMIGALLYSYNEVSFTEMFCPGWSDDSIFLSHMGEANPAACEGKLNLTKIDFAFGDVAPPLVAYGKLRAGKAVFVSIAIGPAGYELIVAPIEMLKPTGAKKFEHTVEGWFRPKMPIARFLEQYSYAGGTHHAGIIYDIDTWEIECFGKAMGFVVTVIE